MEANTTNTSTDGLARGSVRARLAGLVQPGQRRSRKASPGRTNEPGRRLDHYLRDSHARVLHHCLLPGEKDEISHLIVGPAGVTVVDSSHYMSGKARIGDGVLSVRRRRRSDQVGGVLRQLDAVRQLLADTPYSDVPLEAAIAYSRVDGPPVLRDAPRIMVCGTRRIAGEASRPGPLTKRRVTALAAYLDDATHG